MVQIIMWKKKIYVLILVALYFNYNSGYNVLDFIKKKVDLVIDAAGGNTECAHHLKLVMTDLVKKKNWALDMLDASAKLQPGLLYGNLYQYGNFDQCLGIEEVKINDTVIKGKYCTVLVLPSFKIKNDFSFLLDVRKVVDHRGIYTSYHVTDILSLIKVNYGICIPMSCSISTLQDIWNYLENMFALPLHMDFFDFACRYKDKPIDPLPIDKPVYFFFAFIGAIIMLSTIYDITIHQKKFQKQENKETADNKAKATAQLLTPDDNIYMCFSLYSNIKSLFKDKGFEDSSFLSCLNGMKVLSMYWIIHGHRVAANLFAGSINGFELQDWRSKFYNTYLMGASYSVDTFLALSGLLLVFTFLKIRSANPDQPFSYLGFYLYRFLRLTPGLLAMLLFYLSGLKLIADGPLWPLIIKKVIIGCSRTWWATLFFMTNWMDLTFQCIEQSWYLAVDSQLYFLSPIILLNIIKHPKKVIGGMIVTMIVSSIYVYIITVKNEYGAVYFEGNKDYHEYIYQPTYIRIVAWLVGIIFGYYLFIKSKIQISRVAMYILWGVSLSVMVAIQLAHLSFTRYEYSPYRSGIFNATTRIIWSMAVCTIVYLCATGYGGWVNTFLSANFFKISAKLTYSMYLTHLGVVAYMVGSRRTPEHFSTFKGIHDLFGDLALVYVTSTIMCLSFELPMIKIAKLIFKKNKLNTKRQSIGTNTSQGIKTRYVVSVVSLEDLKAKKYEDGNSKKLKHL